MKVLLIGGTHFFGKKILNKLLYAGYDLTVITRGNNKFDTSNLAYIQCDCNDAKKLKGLIGTRTWDVVINQICFDEEAAKIFCYIFKKKLKKVIVTSTILVYDGENAIESDFDERMHTINNKINKTYSEKKKDVEKVISDNFPDCYVLPRLPVVIGRDDYTERLLKYVQLLKEKKAIGDKYSGVPFNLITSDDAAKLIVSLVNSEFHGAINLSSEGMVTVKWIVEYISQAINIEPKWLNNEISPLVFDNMVSMTTRLMCDELQKMDSKLVDGLRDIIDFYMDSN